MGKDAFGEEGMFCQHGGDPDRCIVCNPETGDPNEWNEMNSKEEETKMKTTNLIKSDNTIEMEMRDYIVALQQALSQTTFALETVAHLQHKEKELLPICDYATKVLEDEEGNKLCEY